MKKVLLTTSAIVGLTAPAFAADPTAVSDQPYFHHSHPMTWSGSMSIKLSNLSTQDSEAAILKGGKKNWIFQELFGDAGTAADGEEGVVGAVANDNQTEGNEVLTITTYTDSGRTNAVASASVTINDTSKDVTSASITGPSGSAGDATSSKSINENTTTVHTFAADETVTWSLNGGADTSKFAINTSTGALSFSSAPDYESPTDSDSDNNYVVVVRATDSASNTSDQTLTVSVADVDDTSASITGPSGSAGDSTSTKSINENTTSVHTFTANETVTWSLNGGADASKFAINT